MQTDVLVAGGGPCGLMLANELGRRGIQLPVVFVTAHGDVPLAVEAMRRGARDFIQKPWENERLISILRTQIELVRSFTRISAFVAR